MPRSDRPLPLVLARVRALLTEAPATMGTEPPATMGTEPPATMGTEPPATMGTEPPATAVPQAAAPATAPAAPEHRVVDALAQGRVDPGRRGVLALGALGVVAALLAGGVFLRGRPAEVPIEVPAVASANPSSGLQIVVDVEGKVRRPGLVRLPEGARVDDALRAAGGALPGVPVAGLNLARKLADGEQLLVGLEPVAPTGAGAPGGGGSAGGAGAGGLVDLNLATAADLDALPGIGPVLAQRIVDWRTEHGRFASVDQLREVSGIGESKFATLRAKVRV